MRWNTLQLILFFYVLVALNGTRMVISEEEQRANLFLFAGAAYAATLACIRDSRARGRPLIISLHWLFLALWPIAVPLCLIHSRGWAGLLLIFLHALLFLGVTYAAYNGAGILVHGEGWRLSSPGSG